MSVRAAVERLEAHYARSGHVEVRRALDELRGVDGAARELARLVRDEYPSDHSLREVVETWGRGPTAPDVLDALDRIEAEL